MLLPSISQPPERARRVAPRGRICYRRCAVRPLYEWPHDGLSGPSERCSFGSSNRRLDHPIRDHARHRSLDGDGLHLHLASALAQEHKPQQGPALRVRRGAQGRCSGAVQRPLLLGGGALCVVRPRSGVHLSVGGGSALSGYGGAGGDVRLHSSSCWSVSYTPGRRACSSGNDRAPLAHIAGLRRRRDNGCGRPRTRPWGAP